MRSSCEKATSSPRRRRWRARFTFGSQCQTPAAEGDEVDTDSLVSAVAAVLASFHDFESACTRFRTESPALGVSTRTQPSRWHRGPRLFIEALALAQDAYNVTDGRFDPRVLDVLVGVGYNADLDFSTRTRWSPAKPTPTRSRFAHAGIPGSSAVRVWCDSARTASTSAASAKDWRCATQRDCSVGSAVRFPRRSRWGLLLRRSGGSG